MMVKKNLGVARPGPGQEMTIMRTEFSMRWDLADHQAAKKIAKSYGLSLTAFMSLAARAAVREPGFLAQAFKN
jgi:hypothetical protein